VDLNSQVDFEGMDALQGLGDDDIFNIDNSFAGTIAGGTGDDDFIVADGVVVTGTIDGGASDVDGDQLDMSASTGTLNVAVGGPGSADGMNGTVSGGIDVNFANINVVTAGTAGDDSFNGLNGVSADWTVAGDTGNDYTVGAATLGFENFEVLEGGDGVDTFELGGGSQTGDLTINGGDDADVANVSGDLDVSGNLVIDGVETVANTGAPGEATLSANLLRIVGATTGIGAEGAKVGTDVESLEISNAGSVYISDAGAIGSMTIDSTGTIAVDAESDMVLLEITASGDVILVSASGDVLNGNNDDDINSPEVTASDPESEVRLSAENGVVGTADSPLTISAPNRRNEGIATIFVTATGGKILNPNQALVDTNVAGLDATEAGVSAAVGASVLSALEEIGFINWAGLDPNVRWVDCLEPCIKLPADQLDEDIAGLREPTQMLVIRTVNGIKLIPVFAETTAQLSRGR
jgi:hypothetical protein